MKFVSNFFRHLLNIPNDIDFFWWLKDKQDTPAMQTIGYLVFFVGISLAFKDIRAGFAFMIATGLHEVGHLYQFLKYGIDSHFRVILPFGFAAAPKTKYENKRSDLLHWWKIANILQAGPIVNTILLAIGVFMVKQGLFVEFAKYLVYMNGVLCIFNMLPFGMMDGGQFFITIFSSMKKQFDILLASVVSIAVLIATIEITMPYWSHGGWGIAYGLWQAKGWWIFAFLFAIGTAHKQGMDNDEYWKSAQAMSPIQIFIQLAIYAVNISAALWLFSI